MRYLCLVYGTEDGLPVMQNSKAVSRAEVNALTQDSLTYNDVLRTSGHLIVAHGNSASSELFSASARFKS